MKENYEQQRQLAYELYKKGWKYKEIAEEVGVSLSAVKSWATRYWKNEKVATKEKKKVATKKKRGAPIGNKNATGPPGNKHAEKHGFFSKVLPEETLDLVQKIGSLDALEVLWQNIQLQYVAILRAQKLMFVKDQEDTTKDIIMDGNESTMYGIQHAWDKQANFLSAQSRAMASLNSMIKQYEELSKSTKADELQQARIDLLKAQINKMQGTDQEIEDLSEIEEIVYGSDS